MTKRLSAIPLVKFVFVAAAAILLPAFSANADFSLYWGAAYGFTTDGTTPILPVVGDHTIANLYLAPLGVPDSIGPGGIPQDNDVLLDSVVVTNDGSAYAEYGYFAPILYNGPFQPGFIYGVIFQDDIIEEGDDFYRGPLQVAQDNPATPIYYEMNRDLVYGDMWNDKVIPEHNSPVCTTFDADLEGWKVTGDSTFTWEATTGDPNGCLYVNDLTTGAGNIIIAPAKYHGDWSTLTASDSLTAGIFFRNTSGGAALGISYIFRIAGPGGTAHALEGSAYYPTQNVWNYYTVSIDANDWVIETGDWNDIISTVNSLQIMGEFVNGDEIVRLDNVCLTSIPSYVFVPCLSDNFNTAGTGEWSFQDTGSVSNPGSGGNGGGYVQVRDLGGAYSTAIAPAKFLGDCSSLDNDGYITIDLRIISRSGSDFGVTEFIRISGPGGSAYVTLDPSEFPESSLIWKTFSYPLDSSTWTVDSGTWSGLLANVTECTINLEFYDSSETIGFDNFGRMSSNCPAIDDSVKIYDPNVSACGYMSMVSIYNVAHNPFDDELYGLVRLSPSSGGGLYPVSGPGTGIRIQAYDRPAHLIFDKKGNGFISEDYGGGVFRRDYNGVSSLWVSGFHSGDDDPFGMIFAPIGFNGPAVSEGDILVSDRGNSGADQIWSFSPYMPEGESLVMPDPGNVDQFDLAANPNGKVYVCDALNGNNIYTLDPNGILTPLPLNTSISSIYSIVYDSVEGDIYIASGDAQAVFRVEPVTGDVTLIADGFTSLHPCCLEIDPPKRRLWVADNGYNRVYELCLSGGAAVNISVGLEGTARPAPAGWEIPLFVDFYLPGADVLYDQDVYHCRLTTTKSGDYAVCQVPGVAAGTYDITVVSNHTLLNVKRGVVIAESNTAVCMGTLLEGDAYKDDFVDLYDFSIVGFSWLKSMTDTDFDELADFDRNGVIDIFDLFLLASNWLDSSPIEISACPEQICDDFVDNDADGWTDCDDPDCFSNPACSEQICDDGLDNDGDGWVDCNDSDCLYDPACNVEICDDGIDNDGDTFIDCDDFDCLDDPACNVEICNDGIDNDGDTFIDCDDFDCLDDPACNVEICNDGIDNDGDTFVDCNDFDCLDDPACNVEICNDGIDNDGDTFIDCDDFDCLDDPACNVEICNDGIDNDGDTFIDCDDFDCLDDPACNVEICNDGIDNDGDTFVDCNDFDCVDDPACQSPR